MDANSRLLMVFGVGFAGLVCIGICAGGTAFVVVNRPSSTAVVVDDSGTQNTAADDGNSGDDPNRYRLDPSRGSGTGNPPDPVLDAARGVYEVRLMAASQSGRIRLGTAISLPNASALLQRLTPQHEVSIDNGLLLCSVTLPPENSNSSPNLFGRQNWDPMRGEPDPLVQMQIRGQTLRARSAGNTFSATFSWPSISLEPGDEISVSIYDDDTRNDDFAGSAEGLYAGSLPFPMTAGQVSFTCSAMQGAKLEELLSSQLEHTRSSLTKLEEQALPNGAKHDWGFEPLPYLNAEQAINMVAGIADEDHPALETLIARHAAIFPAWALETWSDVRGHAQQLPDTRSWVPIDDAVQIHIPEISCDPVQKATLLKWAALDQDALPVHQGDPSYSEQASAYFKHSPCFAIAEFKREDGLAWDALPDLYAVGGHGFDQQLTPGAVYLGDADTAASIMMMESAHTTEHAQLPSIQAASIPFNTTENMIRVVLVADQLRSYTITDIDPTITGEERIDRPTSLPQNGLKFGGAVQPRMVRVVSAFDQPHILVRLQN